MSGWPDERNTPVGLLRDLDTKRRCHRWSIAVDKARPSNHATAAVELWRVNYRDLEERHRDLERDYWTLQGQFSELQSQHRQILRLLSPGR